MPKSKIKRIKIKRRETLPDPTMTESKLKYRFNSALKENIKSRSLIAYRKQRGSEIEFTGATILRALETLDLNAETLVVRNSETNDTAKMPVIRITMLAKLLNTSYQTVWRWTSDTDQLPAPILVEGSQGRQRPVYHLDEARIIIRAVGEHLNQFKYYRKDHIGTRDSIFNQIETLRDSNYGVKANGNQEKRSGEGPGKGGKARKVRR